MNNIVNKVKAFRSQKEHKIENLLFSEDIEIVEMILKMRPDLNINAIDEEGRTALFGATYIKAELLIKAGINVNATDKNGNTALFLSDFITTGLLLNKGANINHRNETGMSAIFIADTSKARLLTRCGARVNFKSYTNSITALQMAYRRRDEALMTVLIQAGACIHHNWKSYSVKAKAFMTAVNDKQQAA